MNVEILIAQASEAIKMFRINHYGACVLNVKRGFVTSVPSAEAVPNHPKRLRIERYEMSRGFTNAQWHAIGIELFILYTKEKLCQAHPKP